MGLFISRALQCPEGFWFFPSVFPQPKYVGVPVVLLFSWPHMATAISGFTSIHDNEVTLSERKHLLNSPQIV